MNSVVFFRTFFRFRACFLSAVVAGARTGDNDVNDLRPVIADGREKGVVALLFSTYNRRMCVEMEVL